MIPRSSDGKKKPKKREHRRHFFGRIKNGGYIGLSFFTVLIILIITGLVFPDQWYLLVEVTAIFLTGDFYFEMIIKYQKDGITIPIISKKVTNDYGILFAYFVGVLVSALAIFLFTQTLGLAKGFFQNVLIVPIVSLVLTLLVCLQIKARIK